MRKVLREGTLKDLEGVTCLALSGNRERTGVDDTEDVHKEESRGVRKQPKG